MVSQETSVGFVPTRPTAALNVLVTLFVACLPGNAWASCACAPGGCGSAATASCCSQEAPAAQSCCAAPVAAPSKSECCCTQPAATACSHSDSRTAGSGCECSPARPSQAPAQPVVPSSESKLVATAELPPWAAPVFALDLNALSSAATVDRALHAPPVPLRELYCIWRI